jgi:hypothetical protein
MTTPNTPPQQPNNNFFKLLPNAASLQSALSQAHDYKDELRLHHLRLNKVGIYCKISSLICGTIINDLFPLAWKIALLILSVRYTIKHVIKPDEDVVAKAIGFVEKNVTDWPMLLIVCSTITLLSFIKKKYK